MADGQDLRSAHHLREFGSRFASSLLLRIEELTLSRTSYSSSCSSSSPKITPVSFCVVEGVKICGVRAERLARMLVTFLSLFPLGRRRLFGTGTFSFTDEVFPFFFILVSSFLSCSSRFRFLSPPRSGFLHSLSFYPSLRHT